MSLSRLLTVTTLALALAPLYVLSAPQQDGQTAVRLHTVRRTPGGQFYAAPGGTPDGDGSLAHPWDINTALSHQPAVGPGSVIWLRGGTYGSGSTIFQSALVGTPSAPIVVRQYPGERAVINGWLQIGCCDQDPHRDRGAYVWFWGLEFASSITDRTGAPSGPPDYASSAIQNAVDSWAPGTRLINLVIHDTRQGVGIWKEAVNSEVYGCLIYNNGFQASDRGHGHGIYVQNDGGTKQLTDNVIFDQFGVGIHAYGTDQAQVRNITAEGNIVFNNGSVSTGGGNDDNILFASGSGLQNIVVRNNYTYHTPDGDIGYSRVGWQFDPVNQNTVITNNYWIGGNLAIMVNRWNTATFTGNTVYSKTQLLTYLDFLPGQSSATYTWDGNTYYGSGRFSYAGNETNWQGWTANGIDRDSHFSSGRPSGIWTFVRPNRYEQGRANIVIYNWDLSPSVSVDVSSVLGVGTSYEIRDAENFFGPAVLTGTYDGKPVAIPMTNLKPAATNGVFPTPPKETAPEFGAFIILPKSD
jgi:hypothetical protein